MPSKPQHILIALALVTASLLAYANSFTNPFYSDDKIFFNAPMKDLHYFFYHFLPNRDAVLGIHKMQGDFFYRPLSYVIPSLAYAAFGENPIGHHVLNAVLLGLAGFAVYYMLMTFGVSIGISFLASLFYVIHPINGVVVNYITAGVFSAQVIFMVLSLKILSFPSASVGNPNTSQRTGSPTKAFGDDILSVMFFLLALLCHETAMLLPFYAVAMLKLQGQSWPHVWRKTKWLWALLAGYFLFRLFFISWHGVIFSKVQRFDMTILEYAASQIKIIAWYVTRLFYPDGIVLIWSTPVVKGVGVWLWLTAGLGLVTAMAALIYYHRREYVIKLGLVWFVLGFLPVGLASLYRPPHGFTIEPHWFVFSSVGFFIWVAFVLSRKPLIFRVALIALWLSMVFMYNRLWSNEKQYCTFWLAQAPQMKAVAYVLGDIYAGEGQWGKAIYYYERSLRGTYQDWLTFLKIGIMEAQQEYWERAQTAFANARRIAPQEPVIVNATKHLAQLINEHHQ